MRTLLIGAEAATLIGCSCVLPPQADVNGCVQANGLPCSARTAEDAPIELKPSSTKVHSARKEAKSEKQFFICESRLSGRHGEGKIDKPGRG